MAQKTALSVIALPGKPHSFSPKTAASAKGAGLFTALSVIGLPGKRHSFTAKTEAEAPSGPHTGLFTALSVLALPGKRHSFIAKAEAEAEGRSRWYYEDGAIRPVTQLRIAGDMTENDDAEVMEIITMILGAIYE